MSLVQTVTVGAGGAANIEFTNIPQDATDLLLVLSGRSNSAGVIIEMFVSINGNTTNSNYNYRRLGGTGTSSYSSSLTGSRSFDFANGTSSTANTFSAIECYFTNYTSSANKSFSITGVVENNGSEAYQTMTSQIFTQTAAITSIRLTPDAAFLQHSTASLYKITKA